MSTKRVWTACVYKFNLYLTIIAQGCGSKRELLERLKSDDPVWWQPNVYFVLHKKQYPRRKGLFIGVITDEQRAEVPTILSSKRNTLPYKPSKWRQIATGDGTFCVGKA